MTENSTARTILKRLGGLKPVLRLNQLLAVIALTNLALVTFDYTYIPLRGFWLQRQVRVFGQSFDFTFLPNLTFYYDPIKGIEPHRDTEAYLQTVNDLKQTIDASTWTTIPSEANTDELAQQQATYEQRSQLLEELRRRSIAMIDENPFQVANKSGTLEKIKNRMREHIPTPENSAKEAFKTFWSQDYLRENGILEQFNFFETEIRPLIETNYYRPIGETGQPVDYFWRLDWYFAVLFAIDFLVRSLIISYRRTGVTWFDAMLWRWYDIPIFLPFWRWVRVVPVALRLYEAKLAGPLEKVRRQISQGFVGNFAEDLTEVVILRVINQVQDAVHRGDLTQQILAQAQSPYIDLNNINEVDVIANRLTTLTVNQVLPQLQPDIEAIVSHSIETTLNRLPGYQTLQGMPLLQGNRIKFSDQLATQITTTLYSTINDALNDQKGSQLMGQLAEHLGDVFRSTLQQQEQTVTEIQSLLVDLIEEWKVNYVRRLSQEDIEQILEETRRLRQLAQKASR